MTCSYNYSSRPSSLFCSDGSQFVAAIWKPAITTTRMLCTSVNSKKTRCESTDRSLVCRAVILIACTDSDIEARNAAKVFVDIVRFTFMLLSKTLRS